MLTRTSKAYRHAIATLAFSSFLVFCNLYTVQPMLSLFSEQFNVSESVANWIFASGSLGISCCLIPWAIFADRFGRKIIILTSLILTTLTSLLLFFSNDLTTWIGLRLLQGLSLAGMPAVVVAYITEEFEQNAVISAVGIYIAANTLGGISGRLIGGILSEYFSPNSAMLFCSIITLLGVIATYHYLPKETHFTSQSLAIKRMIENLCQHIKNPQLWRAFLIGGISFGMFINLFSVVGLHLEQEPWNFSTTQVSLIFLCYLSGTATASMAGKLSYKWGMIKTMFIGWGIFSIGILFTLFDSLWLIILGLLICSIGFFLVHSLASAWVGKTAIKARALASALYLSCYYLGASVGGFYLLYFYQTMAWTTVPLSAEVLLLSIPLLILGLKKQ
ncbi:MFS transporter [Otariodibacter oris]|uniref:Putative MFS family arabinose efflux permease n=1 Tax=Otariodibacter oris TaxID=1032623 RepID=A0A420XFG6_9PAST|nr:MFS transporter [Otariodibacter oris]QGM81495.1 bicyclomycin/multidrug efflux system protein [Otariodibacter oris]RKR71101.1 putative MFS family arabinose efflux permease [Otariodibacter oris]